MKSPHIIFSVIPSLILLFISLLIGPGLSPFIGDFTLSISKAVYPSNPSIIQTVEPVSFWYLPFVMYLLSALLIVFFWVRLSINEEFQNSYQSIIYYSKKQKSLLLLINFIPLLFALGFGLVSVKLGPSALFGIALPLFMKSVCIIFTTLFMFNIINEIILQYLLKIKA